jgi:hypothetical protein
MLKKTSGTRPESIKEEERKSSDVDATGSVQKLNGLFRGRGKKPVSIEEMHAAIAKGASRSR